MAFLPLILPKPLIATTQFIQIFHSGFRSAKWFTNWVRFIVRKGEQIINSLEAMKIFRVVAPLLLLSVLVTGCFKDPVIPPPNVSHQGELIFLAKKSNGNPIQGVTIVIAVTQEELRNGNYIAIRYTDINGRAVFGLLNEGTYYYSAEILVDDISFHLEGVAQVKAEQTTSQELTF